MPDCGARAANSGIDKKKAFFRGVFPEREKEKSGRMTERSAAG